MHKAWLINLPTQPKSHINLRDAVRGLGGGGKNKRIGKPTVEQAQGEQGRCQEAVKAEAQPQSQKLCEPSPQNSQNHKAQSTKTTLGRSSEQQFLTAASWAALSACDTAQSTGKGEGSSPRAERGSGIELWGSAGPTTAIWEEVQGEAPQWPRNRPQLPPTPKSEFLCSSYKTPHAGSGSNMGPGSGTKPFQLQQNSQNPGMSRAGRDPQEH